MANTERSFTAGTSWINVFMAAITIAAPHEEGAFNVACRDRAKRGIAVGHVNTY